MDYRANNLKLQKFSLHHLPSLATLLDESFPISIKEKEKAVRWKLLDKIHKNETITYLALTLTDKVVGHYTNLPVTVKRGFDSFKAMICVDMTTAKDYRGLKLISALSKLVYEEVRKNNYDFSVGFSNDQGIKVDKNASGYDYKIVGKFVRYVKIVLTHKKIGIELKKTDKIATDFENHNLKMFHFRKEYSFLNWRYLEKPGNKYQVYSVYNKETDTTEGYLVLRFLFRKCYVYDIALVDLSREKMRTILQSIENEALDQGIRLVVYNVLDNSFWAGLFNRYKYFKNTNNKVNYYLTLKQHKKLKESDELLNKENWFLMNGDII